MLETVLLVDVLIRERQHEVEKRAWRQALLREAPPIHGRHRSVRERLGLALIQVGRSLLRHRPAYVVARRHPA
jgi:hypothetical protein